MKRSILYFITILVSCTNAKPDLNKVANDFADIECRAVHLRETRFAVANQIRFTQDTLMLKPNSIDTSRLQAKLKDLNLEKEAVLKASLTLADSIKHQLDSLTQNYLSDQEDKRKFNQLLNETLQKRGCVDKQ